MGIEDSYGQQSENILCIKLHRCIMTLVSKTVMISSIQRETRSKKTSHGEFHSAPISALDAAHIYKANLEVKQSATKKHLPFTTCSVSFPTFSCCIFVRGAAGVGMPALEDGTLAPVECGGCGALDCGGLWPLGLVKRW